jgi:exo-1,4-beta-D-glucosaminidase
VALTPQRLDSETERLGGWRKLTCYEIPDTSPFHGGWWYRRELDVPEQKPGEQTWLRFDGLNCRGRIWLNGKLVADEKTVVGMFRHYRLNVTGLLVPGQPNVLAVMVMPPGIFDLALTFVDWNPMPPDKDMGLWDDVVLERTGPVLVDAPFVASDLDLPSLASTKLTVSAELTGAAAQEITGTLTFAVEGVEVSQEVTLAPGETRLVTLSPADHPALVLDSPRVWWPRFLGQPEMYEATVSFETSGRVSDRAPRRGPARYPYRRLQRQTRPRLPHPVAR